MNFQILDANKNPISLIQLNQEAAEIWNLEPHSKYYVKPSNNHLNWFEIIGLAITTKTNYYSGWKDVVNNLWENQSEGTNIQGGFNKETNTLDDISIVPMPLERFNEIVKYLKPFIDLINHWNKKGYQPKKID